MSVEDNGEGIADTHRIFEKFYQEERSHTSPGNGLGLALVHRIVALESGLIEVESKKNKGSKFIVRLKKSNKR